MSLNIETLRALLAADSAWIDGRMAQEYREDTVARGLHAPDLAQVVEAGPQGYSHPINLQARGYRHWRMQWFPGERILQVIDLSAAPVEIRALAGGAQAATSSSRPELGYARIDAPGATIVVENRHAQVVVHRDPAAGTNLVRLEVIEVSTFAPPHAIAMLWIDRTPDEALKGECRAVLSRDDAWSTLVAGALLGAVQGFRPDRPITTGKDVLNMPLVEPGPVDWLRQGGSIRWVRVLSALIRETNRLLDRMRELERDEDPLSAWWRDELRACSVRRLHGEAVRWSLWHAAPADAGRVTSLYPRGRVSEDDLALHEVDVIGNRIVPAPDPHRAASGVVGAMIGADPGAWWGVAL